MNYYEPCGKYEYTVEYTLQFGRYVGKFRTKVVGNIRGLNVLALWDFEENRLDSAGVSFDFRFEDNEDFIYAVLIDPKTGDTCEIEDTPNVFNDHIVKAEIIKAVEI